MIPDLGKVLRKMSNPFIKLTGDEEASLSQIELSVKRDIKKLSSEAKELYDDQRYQKLKKEFQSIYESSLKLIIYYNCEDANKYIMKMREFQIRLRTLKSIFDTPEGFIKQEEEIESADKDEHQKG